MDLSREQHLSLIAALAEEAGGRFRYLNNQHAAYRPAEGEWVKIGSHPDAFAVEKALGIQIDTLPQVADKTGAVAKVKDARWLERVFNDIANDENVDSPEAALSAFKQRLQVDGAMVRGPDVQVAVPSVFHDHRYSRDRIAALMLKSISVVRRVHHGRPSKNMFEPEQLDDASATLPTLNAQGKQGVAQAVKEVAKRHAMRPEALQLDLHHVFYRASLSVDMAGYGENPHPDVWVAPVAHAFERARQYYVEKSDIAGFDKCLDAMTIRVSPLGVNLFKRPQAQSLQALKAQLKDATSVAPPATDTPPMVTGDLLRKKTLAAALMMNDRLSGWERVLPYMFEGSELSAAKETLSSIRHQALPFTHKDATDNLSALCEEASRAFGAQWKEIIERQQKQQLARVKAALSENVSVIPAIQSLQQDAPDPKTEPENALKWFGKMDAYLSPERLAAWSSHADRKGELTIPHDMLSRKLGR